MQLQDHLLQCSETPAAPKHCAAQHRRGCAHIGAGRKGLLLAGDIAIGAEDDGPAALVLMQQAAVLEVRDQAALALDPRVADVAHLLAVEFLPLLRVEALEQRRDVLWQDLHHARPKGQTMKAPACCLIAASEPC